MARFVANRAFKAELQAEPEFQAGTARITVEVAESIKAAARVFKDTGHYIDAVQTRKNRVHLEPHFAHIIELGSVNNPPQANVRRGVNTLGMRFQDDGPQQAA